ncbi:bifunctional diaminohydroxyphosphoribosylaminopyrimidine deaminase/5-amino-6-(5-phosphoribosylamino)uracil reductase RibD [Rossellomorea aquimaris]|uniref:bifunctional diaminohydroxyphosphoribosylaminopyrimidine deaminase/5-amino-6-(5-phosphoribosylamino)uracil reductase RibD n=1 Tax=Rossellomorea aquimaris TaxID=189382 RepID=UPI001CD59A71|nr:bifunctional diaminohydroxyphosphoribosylaminopyrimidine deaminase/5-amino-6-(5-phosphoribosylamino)uracil reductase RibD [Rossellomorea aquimaris]MCA1054488.1 bifunctional diaminohydroxyphosphoribosylaminopyrimidine deaminase/5-amino-6-(5-phosphoribosylamino)uracil reductase RibD [Rossellomorea aquimaris]
MTHSEYMELALNMARATQGQTSPNPAVGAVVVKDGAIVGMGAHLKAGEGHAEVHAIEAAGEKAAGADIYVTLEPCSHHGRTPPCSQLIISSGIKRVFIATTDPNPLVSGSGIEQLRKAGIDVHLGECQEEALELNKFFFHFMKYKKPYVTLKTAVTLDGKTAAHSGDSKWITSEQSRLDVHYDRHRHDAILVGVNTIIRDNPHLTTRLPQGGKNPIRIILDHDLRTPLASNVVNDHESKTIIMTNESVTEDAKQPYVEAGCEVISLPGRSISLEHVLTELGTRSIQSVYVEGGSTIHGSFLEERCFQELIMYMAPKLIGGRNAFSSFGGAGASSIIEGLEMDILSIDTIGQDIKIVAVPKKDSRSKEG